jgi:DNA-binding transcriptional MerR regulator
MEEGKMSSSDSLTIEQLATTVGMTVRNIRAYAGRGLLPAPRLVGRKGFYGPDHLARLNLIRDLLGRGYTLAAVENALTDNPELADPHALDFLGLLSNPIGEEEPEIISIAELTRLAGLTGEDAVIGMLLRELIARGLADRLDEKMVSLSEPVLIRAGAQAISIGLSPETVLDLLADLRDDLAHVAERFVDVVRAEIWRPFVARGLPQDEWDELISSIEGIIPVAVQATMAMFRHELGLAIESGVGAEIQALTGYVDSESTEE